MFNIMSVSDMFKTIISTYLSILLQIYICHCKKLNSDDR